MSTEDILLDIKTPIVVVGNSTVTINYGSIIDIFPTVIRINNYKIEGYESLVGTKTDFRCTSGCTDIEYRENVIEFSPFIEDSPESFDISNYSLRTGKELCLATTDVKSLTHLERPSTGFALLLLLNYLNIKTLAIGFDGFQTPNLGQATIVSTHSTFEINLIKEKKNIILI